MTTIKLSLPLLAVVTCFIVDASSQKVSTSIGDLNGLRVKTVDFDVDQYLGVPYAMPPIDSLRFQLPSPLSTNSSRVIDATNYGPTCVQSGHIRHVINPVLNYDSQREMSEDCLYLNIFAPSGNRSKLPVLVWIPGEGFDFADAKQFDGSYLASRGQMIVVTVQYRVGVFGFLKYKDLAPGNMGLWDQIEALRWIQKNIGSFGGNPNEVTIAGRFSGSMSISILLTSPVLQQQETLFTRSMLMSGVAVKEWTFESRPFEKASTLFTKLNCLHESTAIVSKCLANIDSQTLSEKSFYFWKPTLDGHLIKDYPQQSLSKGKVATGLNQVLMGSTQVEGHLCYLRHLASKADYFEKLYRDSLTDEDFHQMSMENIKEFSGSRRPHDCPDCYKAIEIGMKAKRSLRQRYLDFCSALYIQLPMEHLATLLTTQTDVKTFMYRFSQRTSFSILPPFIDSAGHGDDVLLLFALSKPNSTATDKDRATINAFVGGVSDFVHNDEHAFDDALTTSDSLKLVHFTNAGGYAIFELSMFNFFILLILIINLTPRRAIRRMKA